MATPTMSVRQQQHHHQQNRRLSAFVSPASAPRASYPPRSFMFPILKPGEILKCLSEMGVLAEGEGSEEADGSSSSNNGAITKEDLFGAQPQKAKVRKVFLGLVR